MENVHRPEYNTGPRQRGFLKQKKVGDRPFVDYKETLSLVQNALLIEIVWNWREHLCGSLLDAGCGKRPYSLIYEATASKAIGVDVETTPHTLDAVDVVASLESLPFEDGTFDSILCTEVLEHVPDVERAWSELARVLKPGGRMIVTVPFIYPEHEAPYDFRRFTVNGLITSAERHGFQVREVTSRGGPVPLLFALGWSLICMRLIAGCFRRLLGLEVFRYKFFRWLWSLPQWVFLAIYMPVWRRRLGRKPSSLDRWLSMGYATVLEKV